MHCGHKTFSYTLFSNTFSWVFYISLHSLNVFLKKEYLIWTNSILLWIQNPGSNCTPCTKKFLNFHPRCNLQEQWVIQEYQFLSVLPVHIEARREKEEKWRQPSILLMIKFEWKKAWEWASHAYTLIPNRLSAAGDYHKES